MSKENCEQVEGTPACSNMRFASRHSNRNDIFSLMEFYIMLSNFVTNYYRKKKHDQFSDFGEYPKGKGKEELKKILREHRWN